VAAYFRTVRKKYAQFEGQLKGVDSRILIAQVPGGMLTNMEGQLKEQGAADRLDEVLDEIPRVREDLGYIPLVTPTSQIVGSQAVINVLTGERYKSITKETAALLKGEYGKAPAPVNAKLQAQVLDGEAPITCRPADKLAPELDALTQALIEKADAENVSLADDKIDDVLTYALFPQVGWKFLQNRGNPDAFEPAPTGEAEPASVATKPTSGGEIETYSVRVNGQVFNVDVGPDGALGDIQPSASPATSVPQPSAAQSQGEPVTAPLAGNIFKVMVSPGEHVQEGDVLIVLEAMKMETEVRAAQAGTVQDVQVKEGDAVTVGMPLLHLG
jgi:oxaloacetate decarboxylase alpha subunit